jgi:hypothetical protein
MAVLPNVMGMAPEPPEEHDVPMVEARAGTVKRTRLKNPFPWFCLTVRIRYADESARRTQTIAFVTESNSSKETAKPSEAAVLVHAQRYRKSIRIDRWMKSTMALVRS